MSKSIIDEDVFAHGSHSMSAPPPHPFELIARVLAEGLGGGPASQGLRDTISHPAVRWEEVVGRASEDYVLAAFAGAIRDLCLCGLLEPELRAFLESVHAANLERNRALRAELRALCARLDAIGVKAVVLKGAIRLIDSLYYDPGWRMMRDLDLLLPAGRLADAVTALEAAGYAAIADDEREPGHHHPPLIGPGGRVAIELHTALFATRERCRLLPADEVLEAARPADLGGVAVRIPTPEHQLVHLIAHAQISGRGHATGRIELRDRLEAACLARRSSDHELWRTIAARFAACGHARPFATFVQALGDAGLKDAPCDLAGDVLARLQAWRIARQARSAPLMRIGCRLGWYTSVLRELALEHERRRHLLGMPLAALAVRLRRSPPAR